MPTLGKVPTVGGRNASLATNPQIRNKTAGDETSFMKISACLAIQRLNLSNPGRMDMSLLTRGCTPAYMLVSRVVAYMNGPKNIGKTLKPERQTPASSSTGWFTIKDKGHQISTSG